MISWCCCCRQPVHADSEALDEGCCPRPPQTVLGRRLTIQILANLEAPVQVEVEANPQDASVVDAMPDQVPHRQGSSVPTLQLYRALETSNEAPRASRPNTEQEEQFRARRRARRAAAQAQSALQVTAAAPPGHIQIPEAPPQYDQFEAAVLLSALPRESWSTLHNQEPSEEGSVDECRICLEEYTVGEEIVRLPCMHYAHTACLETWLIRCPRCPMCWTSAQEAIQTGF